MNSHYILVDILVAKELAYKGKEQVARSKKLRSLVSKNLDKGGTLVVCFKDFKNIDFEKDNHSFKE